jgi:Xaa-Pro dipeptidase
MVFRQESNFYYLTGCTVPGSYLLITFQSGTSFSQKPNVELFIPKIKQADLMWSVPPPTPENALQTHNVSSVNHPEDVSKAIATHLKAFPDALFHTLPKDSPLFPKIPSELVELVTTSENGAVTDAYLLNALHKARLIKDEEETALIRKANEISSRAHETVMRVLGAAVKNKIEKAKGAGVDRPLLPGEWLIEKEAEAEAIFVASCRREG